MNTAQAEADVDNGRLFDVARLRKYARFLAGSMRRHAVLAFTTFTLTIGLVALGLWAFPKTYHAETRVLAQRNPVLPVRGDQPGAETPTRSATETILRHDNLVALIEQAGLLEHYRAHRAPIVRLKDYLMHLVASAETDQDKVDGMVEVLEKKLVVWTNEGTVSIAIDWSDPAMAFRLVSMSQQNFLEARQAAEISAIAESLSILQGHAASLRADIDDAVGKVKKLREEAEDGEGKGRGKHASHAADARAEAPVPAARKHVESGADVGHLRSAIEAKTRAIADLEDFRRRRLSELQGKLAEERAVYTENHPAVVDLEQTIATLSSESPQVVAMRKDLSGLRSELDRATRSSGGDRESARPLIGSFDAAPPQLPRDILSLDREPREERDPAMVYARGQLRDAMDKYDTLRGQIQTAQIDLETAEAAFKYRYSVVLPPQVPKHAKAPKVVVIVPLGIVGAIFLALLAVIVADVRSGRLFERWQVEDLLAKPVLGHLSVPILPQHDPE